MISPTAPLRTGLLLPAPVVLFVYNRPEHTRRTLTSLAANPLASRSRLIVFSDGARPGDESLVAAVRAVVRERAWCGEVELRESPANRGLAASIIGGVTAVLEVSERIIVLEDDLELSPGFLAYMNDALELHAAEPRVMSVSAWMPALAEGNAWLPETFLLRTIGSWGWATWRRAWAYFEGDAAAFVRRLQAEDRRREFDVDGGYDYFGQLVGNVEGRISTWGVLWYASVFFADGLNLHPRQSLVRNIGHDGSGSHSEPDPRYGHEILAERIHVAPIPLEADATARAAYRRHVRGMPGRGMCDVLRGWLGRFARAA